MSSGRKLSIVGETHELVVCGSGGVGKSCLTLRFLKDQFNTDYDPTIGRRDIQSTFTRFREGGSYLDWRMINLAEENYQKNIIVDGKPCMATIIDTAGQQEYTALRDQHLRDGEGFILVFALNDRKTFEEVKQLRDKIIRIKDTRKVPFVICGNKCDLSSDKREVDVNEVTEYCKCQKIPFLETSAKEDTNVAQLFHDLIRECRNMMGAPSINHQRIKAKRPKSSSKCNIL